MIKPEKPPIGIKPAWIVQRDRIFEIVEAMERYSNAGVPIPPEWFDELVIHLRERVLA